MRKSLQQFLVSRDISGTAAQLEQEGEKGDRHDWAAGLKGPKGPKGLKGSARPGRDAVAYQPCARFGQDVGPGYLDAPVHEQQRPGGQLRRDAY